MANQQHIDWLKQGVQAWNAMRQNRDFVPDLEGANLLDIPCNEANLERANLRSAHIPQGQFNQANLMDADLSHAHLAGAVLKRANLMAAKAVHANLSGADLMRVYLNEANLEHAILTGANLLGGHLIRINLAHADLQRANFKHANARHVCFTGANLKGAHLEGADLREIPDEPIQTADGQPYIISQAQINSAFGNETTLLPTGLVCPDHWTKSTNEKIGYGSFQETSIEDGWQSRQSAQTETLAPNVPNMTAQKCMDTLEDIDKVLANTELNADTHGVLTRVKPLILMLHELLTDTKH